MSNHHFISYSSNDAEEFAIRLRDELEAGPPSIPVWFDKRDIRPQRDWDQSLENAIKTCDSVLFVMTRDSVEDESVCKREWTSALRYKKPIIPIRLHANAEMPFRLSPRQHIDFSKALKSKREFNSALAKLRKHLEWLTSPEGVLQATKDRLADAQRDLRREEDPGQKQRIRDEIKILKRQISRQQAVVDDPQEAARRVDKSIKRGLKRERLPQRSARRLGGGKLINDVPTAPSYFQNRHVETKLMGDFLKDETIRLIILVGRGGTGKTAMVCRLLKSLEGDQLPDGLGRLKVDGIVYLSTAGTRRLSMPNLFADLSKLLPAAAANHLDVLSRNPQISAEAKMQALLTNFPQGRTVLLLDNFEDVINRETLHISDSELDAALRAVLDMPHHAVKVILTTRVAPRELLLLQPGRQRRIDLDDGLASPYAENILREMDADGKVGLKTAPDDLLYEARQRTRGYPRALEALFAILSADRDTSLRDILNDVEKRMPDNVVRDLVGEAFSRLDTTAQQVMQALAVYARPVMPAAIDYLLKPYLPGVNSAVVLSRLVNMHFAHKEDQRYYLHSVDRAYAFNRIPKGEQSDRDEQQQPRYTRHALLHRGAQYFKEARTPPETWKTIADLAPVLAEFDLRCVGEDYDAAARVLLEIHSGHLYVWGHYNEAIEMHERLRDKIKDLPLMQDCLGSLGFAYLKIGHYQKAISYIEPVLNYARDIKDKERESVWLGILGACYENIGQTTRVEEFYKQSLALGRESGNRYREQVALTSLGINYSKMGNVDEALSHYEQALTIASEIKSRFDQAATLINISDLLISMGRCEDAARRASEGVKIGTEIASPTIISHANGNVALAYLCMGDLPKARAAAEAACRYDVPEVNHYQQALVGLVAIRQADYSAARGAFTTALLQADRMLANSSQNYSAFDSKALALCGLTLCGDSNRMAEAMDAYRAARAINKDAGTVKRVLQLLDVLAAADSAGLLPELRPVAAGES